MAGPTSPLRTTDRVSSKKTVGHLRREALATPLSIDQHPSLLVSQMAGRSRYCTGRRFLARSIGGNVARHGNHGQAPVKAMATLRATATTMATVTETATAMAQGKAKVRVTAAVMC
jgi:hypothetical protein